MKNIRKILKRIKPGQFLVDEIGIIHKFHDRLYTDGRMIVRTVSNTTRNDKVVRIFNLDGTPGDDKSISKLVSRVEFDQMVLINGNIINNRIFGYDPDFVPSMSEVVWVIRVSSDSADTQVSLTPECWRGTEEQLDLYDRHLVFENSMLAFNAVAGIETPQNKSP